jgi:hypothetical protein
MTLAPKQEHAMTAKSKQPSEPFDAVRFRKELNLKISRLVAETIEGWPGCENTRCRRAQRCASDRFECIGKWRESLPPLSPEEARERLEDFRISVQVRRRLAGQTITVEQLAEAIRKEKAARLAALPPRGDDATPPVAEETKLAPEKQERVERAWKEHVASQPAEQDRKREPGPRITQL